MDAYAVYKRMPKHQRQANAAWFAGVLRLMLPGDAGLMTVHGLLTYNQVKELSKQ